MNGSSKFEVKFSFLSFRLSARFNIVNGLSLFDLRLVEVKLTILVDTDPWVVGMEPSTLKIHCCWLLETCQWSFTNKSFILKERGKDWIRETPGQFWFPFSASYPPSLRETKGMIGAWALSRWAYRKRGEWSLEVSCEAGTLFSRFRVCWWAYHSESIALPRLILLITSRAFSLDSTGSGQPDDYTSKSTTSTSLLTSPLRVIFKNSWAAFKSSFSHSFAAWINSLFEIRGSF